MVDSLEEIKQTALILDLTDASSFCQPLSFFEIRRVDIFHTNGKIIHMLNQPSSALGISRGRNLEMRLLLL